MLVSVDSDLKHRGIVPLASSDRLLVRETEVRLERMDTHRNSICIVLQSNSPPDHITADSHVRFSIDANYEITFR